MTVPTQTAVRYAVVDGLARLTLDVPDRGNPIDGAFACAMKDIANDMSERDDVRAVLITANGRVFSVGGDIKAFATSRAQLPSIVKAWTVDLHSAITRLIRMRAPVVTALTGNVGGGSVSFVAASDIVVAGEGVKLASGFAALGFSPDTGSTVSLVQRMGHQRAKRFIMLAEVLDARAAEAAGLVDIVVPADAVLREAEAIATRLAQGPTEAYAGIKRLMMRARTASPETQMEEEAQTLAAVVRTDDAWEGISAFVAKRAPKFRGK